jgi:hypothetical protein
MNASRRLAALLGAALGVLVAALPARADAHEPSPVGVAASGMRGLVNAAQPWSPEEINVAGTAGYGMTESIAPVDGAHHRVAGVLGASVAPLPWLAVGLRIDGRVDLHPDEGDGPHGTAIGDPRLLARVGGMLGSELSIGSELAVWFPGQNAPSYEPSATTVDLKGLFAYQPEASGFALLVNAGFRLDQSGNSSPDLSRLTFGDRIALGISDSHAVLGALGAAYRINATELFAELSADLLVGSRAPELLASPLRAALGVRYAASDVVSFELSALSSLSKRPAVTPDAPLVPIEPRIAVMLGLRLSFGLGEAKESFVAPDEEKAPIDAKAVVKPPEPEKPANATVTGVLNDDSGEPLSEALVRLRDTSGEEREAITDAEGRYSFTEVPLGAAALEASATGFEAQSWQLDVRADIAPEAPRTLAQKTTIGVLRGLVRSFASEPLRAEVTLRDEKQKQGALKRVRSSEKGEFEIELPPGRYRVTIRAEGYKTHTRSVKVEANGVAILNVDLREAR